MKKLISVLMIVALMAAFMAVSAFATETPQIVVESATAKVGEEVVLTVSLVNNPGITNGKITVTFDETAFKLVDLNVATMDNFTNGINCLKNVADKAMSFVVVPADEEGNPIDFVGDVVLFEIKLKVLDEAVGDYNVGLEINLMKNNAEENVVFEVVEGVVTVAHDCALEDVAEVPATCTEDGVKAHQKCSICGKLYIDGVEVTEEELVIPAAHTPAEPVKENEVAATCTTDGSYEEVVYCTECGEELSRVKVVVPAAHNFVDGVCTECGEKDPNPETGDFVYVAVATALVSMMGIVALTKKKEF